MSLNSTNRISRLIKWYLCLLPFAVFYWLVPFCGRLTIGNDYPRFPIQHQMEAQYSLAHGSFPLYSPGFAGGRSAAALTLGQTYHPIAWLAAHSPRYWKGAALEWNTFWRLVSLGLTQLVLFTLLRKLELRVDVAFLISFITVYNQRMLDMFRYGASLENYTGFLLLCGAMGHFYLAPHRLAGPLSMIGATWLLICGGHPQIAYLGLLGAGLIGAVLPFAIAAIQPGATLALQKTRNYYATVAGSVAVGVLLASAYAFPFYFEFLKDAPERVGRSYEWSLTFSDNWIGALNGFFNPLHSDVHGAFGSSPLILLAMFVPIAALMRGSSGWIMAVLWLAGAAIILCSVGNDTPVHRWFWMYFPLASSFRTPGRIAMLLPPLFLLMLAWFFRAADEKNSGERSFPLTPWKFVAQAGAVFALWFLLGNADFYGSGHYTPARIEQYPHGVDAFILWNGLGTLVLAGVRVSACRFRNVAGVLLAILVVLQAVVQLQFGTWTVERQPTPTLQAMDEEKRVDLAFRGEAGYGMEGKTVLASNSLPAWYPVFDRMATNPLAGASASAVLILPRPGELKENVPPDASQRDRVVSVYSSFNRVKFHAGVQGPGFLSFSVPYSPQWHAWVDGHDAPVYRTEWGGQAIHLSTGSHDVEFRFQSPAAVAGMAVSLLTALCVILYCLARRRRGRVRLAAMIAAVLVAAGGFGLWRHSLYHGADLGTRYEWFSGKPMPEPAGRGQSN